MACSHPTENSFWRGGPTENTLLIRSRMETRRDRRVPCRALPSPTSLLSGVRTAGSYWSTAAPRFPAASSASICRPDGAPCSRSLRPPIALDCCLSGNCSSPTTCALTPTPGITRCRVCSYRRRRNKNRSRHTCQAARPLPTCITFVMPFVTRFSVEPSFLCHHLPKRPYADFAPQFGPARTACRRSARWRREWGGDAISDGSFFRRLAGPVQRVQRRVQQAFRIFLQGTSRPGFFRAVWEDRQDRRRGPRSVAEGDSFRHIHAGRLSLPAVCAAEGGPQFSGSVLGHDSRLCAHGVARSGRSAGTNEWLCCVQRPRLAGRIGHSARRNFPQDRWHAIYPCQPRHAQVHDSGRPRRKPHGNRPYYW